MTLNSLLARKAKRPHNPGEQGQGLVEYALILVLVAVVVIVILALMGPAVSNVYCTVVLTLNPNETCTAALAEEEEKEVPPGSFSYACTDDHVFQFIAYTPADSMPYYQSSNITCTPGSDISVTIPMHPDTDDVELIDLTAHSLVRQWSPPY